MEIKQQNTYIFKYQKAGHRSPFKGLVKEITQTTYLIENLDSGAEFRTDIESFNSDYKAVELIQDWNKTIENLVKDINTSPFQPQVDPVYPYQDFTHPCWNKSCYCDGSCQRVYGPNSIVDHNLLSGPGVTSGNTSLNVLKQGIDKINNKE